MARSSGSATRSSVAGKGGKGRKGGTPPPPPRSARRAKRHRKMAAAPAISRHSTLQAMLEAAAEATQGKFEVFRMVACFLDETNKTDWIGGSKPGEYERGCSLSTAQARLKMKKTVACIVELTVQEQGQGSQNGMGPHGGVPSAHSMALVKHAGKLYVYDPQFRATQPGRGTISPAGLRPLLGSFGKGNVHYKSGDLPARDEKCRAGVLAFIARLAAGMDEELAGFKVMAR